MFLLVNLFVAVRAHQFRLAVHLVFFSQRFIAFFYLQDAIYIKSTATKLFILMFFSLQFLLSIPLFLLGY